MEQKPETPTETQETDDTVLQALRRVKDPDLGINIVDLGLVYAYEREGSTVLIDLTLTSPGCPAGAQIIADIEQTVKSVPVVEEVKVSLVWAPPWSAEKINPRVKAYLGF